jgi:hypothetical protein
MEIPCFFKKIGNMYKYFSVVAQVHGVGKKVRISSKPKE